MSSKQKKEDKKHHQRGSSSSKPSSSSHNKNHSRDSALGSSVTTASDRASVGMIGTDDRFDSTTIEDQRYNLRVVQEALDAANDKISVLEKENDTLNESLASSNKENRTLKKEKSGLLEERVDLMHAIDELNRRLENRESSPRSMAAAANNHGRSSPSIRERQGEAPRRRQQEGVYQEVVYEEVLPSPRQPSHIPSSSRQVPLLSDRERRSSLYERHNPPAVPTPPRNPHLNPFLPRTTQQASYSPAMVSPHVAAYTGSNVGYTTAPPIMSTPSYAISTTSASNVTNSSRRRDNNDGRYHPAPL